MSSLIFILMTTLKNRVIELKTKPARLILYVIGMLFMGFMLYMAYGKVLPAELPQKQDIFLLKGIVFFFLSFSFYTAVKTGLSTGGSFFDMCDVNMLFVSPINSKLILAYGLLRQAGTSFLVSLFIFFQAQNLKRFGVGFKELMLLFFSYFFGVILFQTLSIFIYSVTNGNQRRKTITNGIFTMFLGIMIALAGFEAFSGATFLAGVRNVMQMPITDYIPFIGWVTSFTIAFIAGNTWSGFVFLFISLLSLVAMVLFVAYSKDDYYEDVLVATETMYERKLAIKEGNLNGATTNNRKIKVHSTGVWGNGARAIFGKHLRELQRSSYLGILNMQSVMFIVGSIGFTLFMKTTEAIFIILGFSMYVQALLIGTGLGVKELYFHYIYLIPQGAFKKIIWSNMEIFMRTFLESSIMFMLVGIMLNINPFLIFLCIIIRTVFSVLLVGVNFSSLRLFKGELNVVIVLYLYFLFIVLVLSPGIIAGFTVMILLKNIELALLTFLFWLIIISVFFIFISRKILHNCDIATMMKR